jgi:hypothetical protein
MAKSKLTGDYCTLTESEQRKLIGAPPGTVCNLGHDVSIDKIADNPVKASGPAQGTVAKGINKSSGIPSQANLDDWANYSTKNSYHTPRRKK